MDLEPSRLISSPSNSGTSHNFSSALAIWKQIDLSNLQTNLQTQGEELLQNQKESLIGRKKLADQTRGKFIPLKS
jgi:homeobox protein cut-like